MDWIFDNLQLIIVIAGAIAYWFNQRAREKAGQDADYDGDGIPENRPAPRAETRELGEAPPREGFDTDQEERARRIREEIQRKIAERRGQAQGQGGPPPMPAPPRLDPFRPVFQEDAAPTPPPLRPSEPPPLVREVVIVNQHDDSALERQRRLAEQMEQLEEQRRESRRRVEEARAASTSKAPASSAGRGVASGVGSRSVGEELRDPRALRRAFVLREVLSAPVALR